MLRKQEERELLIYLKKISLSISNEWLQAIKKWLYDYLNFVDWKINEEKTLEYLEQIKRNNDVETFRKITYQIRKFLKYLGARWAESIMVPPMKEYNTKRIDRWDITNLIGYFVDKNFYTRHKALILFCATSGIRACELYKQKMENFDLA